MCAIRACVVVFFLVDLHRRDRAAGCIRTLGKKYLNWIISKIFEELDTRLGVSKLVLGDFMEKTPRVTKEQTHYWSYLYAHLLLVFLLFMCMRAGRRFTDKILSALILHNLATKDSYLHEAYQKRRYGMNNRLLTFLRYSCWGSDCLLDGLYILEALAEDWLDAHVQVASLSAMTALTQLQKTTITDKNFKLWQRLTLIFCFFLGESFSTNARD